MVKKKDVKKLIAMIDQMNVKTDQAIAAIDDALEYIHQSNSRIEDMEKAKEKETYTLHELLAQSQTAFAASDYDSVEEVAEFLSITSSAVHKRLEKGYLLALPFGDNCSYLVWQFTESGVVNEFPEVMNLLKNT